MSSPYNGPWQAVRRAVLERDRYLCQLRLPGCRRVATSVDHVVGLAQGGQRYEGSNLVAACMPCNVAKGNMQRKQPPPPRPSREW